MTKISVITPTYNSEKTIRTTLEALLAQTFSDFEYIIIDGLSRDNTIKVIEGYIPEFEMKGVKVTIVNEKDNGVYDAMNKGISMANGELIGITNSDDWYESIALETMWDKYTDGIVEKDNCMLYGVERVWQGDKVYNLQRRGADYLGEGVMPHSTFFVSKSVYNRCGAFDLSVRILADYDFICRCVKQGVQLLGVDVVISNFYLGGISSSFFDFYTDFYTIQHKYGYISDAVYKERMLLLKVKKLINKVSKRY